MWISATAITSWPRTSSIWCWRRFPGPGRPDHGAGRASGISLFIVPKWLVDEEGTLTGERNDVALAGLNHKCSATAAPPNTLLNFGEGRFKPVRGQAAGAIGYLRRPRPARA